MKIDIVEKNYDVGTRLEGLIEKKVGKLDKYFDKNTSCKVVCKKEGNLFKLEISIAAKNAFFRSEVADENMYNNLDIALPKLEKQILKFKGKKKDFKFPTLPEELLFLEEIPEEKPSKISKRKSFSLTPVSEDEAVFMLEAVDHDFYVFLNTETGKINILYRRQNGEYGLIEVNK